VTWTMQRAEQNLIPSVVDLVVTWLKTRPNVTAVCGTRISSTLPTDSTDIIYPWLTVQRVIGITALPEAAIDRARVQFNAWGGNKANGAPNWEPADSLIRAVELEVRTLIKANVTGKGFIMATGLLEGIQQIEDPDTGEARFWMDAIFVVKGI